MTEPQQSPRILTFTDHVHKSCSTCNLLLTCQIDTSYMDDWDGEKDYCSRWTQKKNKEIKESNKELWKYLDSRPPLYETLKRSRQVGECYLSDQLLPQKQP